MHVFFLVTSYLYDLYRIFTEYAALDRLWWVSHWLLTYPSPSRPLCQKRNVSHNFLLFSPYVDQFEISACIRLIPALVVGCLRVFLAALSKVFRKASLSLMKEQFSRMAKSAASNFFSYFVSLRATRVKDWSRAWDGEIGYCELCCWQ